MVSHCICCDIVAFKLSYEIVKMLLLAAILIVVIYKPSAKKGATTVALLKMDCRIYVGMI